MQKYFKAFILALGLIAVPFAAPHMAYAACSNDGGVSTGISSLFTVQFCSANGLLIGIVQILLSIAGMTAVLFIAIGGFRYIIAAREGKGDKEIEVAKGMITNAIIGLVIIVMAYTIVTVIVNTVQNNASSGASSGGAATGVSPNPGGNGPANCDLNNSCGR